MQRLLCLCITVENILRPSIVQAGLPAMSHDSGRMEQYGSEAVEGIQSNGAHGGRVVLRDVEGKGIQYCRGRYQSYAARLKCLEFVRQSLSVETGFSQSLIEQLAVLSSL